MGMEEPYAIRNETPGDDLAVECAIQSSDVCPGENLRAKSVLPGDRLLMADAALMTRNHCRVQACLIACRSRDLVDDKRNALQARDDLCPILNARVVESDIDSKAPLATTCPVVLAGHPIVLVSGLGQTRDLMGLRRANSNNLES